MLRNSKKIIITIILILIILNLAGCGNKNKNEKLQKKVATELEYVNVKIIDLLNALNNLSFKNYTISTEKVKLDDNTDKKENEQGSDSKSKMGEEGSGSQAQGETQSNSQTQENGSQDLINTTEMITDATLMKDKNNIKYKLVPNFMFEDTLHEHTILETEFAIKNEEMLQKINLQEIYMFMPNNKKWLEGSKAAALIAEAIFKKAKVKYILPTDLNIIK